MRPQRIGLFLWAVALCLSLAAAFPADIIIPPAPNQWATDTAGFLSSAALDFLNNQLQAFSQINGQQVLVYIGKTTAGYPIEEFAVKAFEAWKPGRKGLDDGLILFIMAEDRKSRIEVGYGLEDRVTDAKSSRIINEILVPRIRAGDNDGAVKGAVEAILSIVSGKPFGPQPENEIPPPSGQQRTSPVNLVLMIIGGFFFLILFITHPGFALWLLFNILSGGRGGGGFGGGGGFRGGGGRSGGGGASGGW